MLFILILIICTILQFFTPWWVVMLVPFLLALWKSEKAGRTFLEAFGAIFLCWLVYSFFIHFKTAGILTSKVAEMLMVKSSMVLIAVTAIIGGLSAGLAALTGYFCKKAFLSNSAEAKQA
ncbi:hypothetical protein [Solitalea lacus]|uniref:hypothetical protein n=1 Tax=Solitalea lacus TaxID=2911172 RepID=UPI001EDAF4AE|nr:hypothetical protein [Solitalea lacus]UKJ08749.1 hypothetical protein L2B55_06180 [Solitalea lacus]